MVCLDNFDDFYAPETKWNNILSFCRHERFTLMQGDVRDRDLLRYFKSGQEGIWHLLAKVKQSFKEDACRGDLTRCLTETTAGIIMTTELITVREEMLIETAIGLMVDKGLKRLPVVDAAGRFKGMISRDSLLRTGFGGFA